MSKTIFVGIDGTGQTHDQATKTNIALLFDAAAGEMVDAVAADGDGAREKRHSKGGKLIQIAKYFPGIGTEGSALGQLFGKAAGVKIDEAIIRAYTFVSRNYESGDEIVITGFSRGATSARSLNDFIAKMGLLDRSQYDPADKDQAYKMAMTAWAAYRTEHCKATPIERVFLWLRQQARKLPSPETINYVEVPEIKAIGVFDTVQSLGMPNISFLLNSLKYKFKLTNGKLSPKTLFGFQAIAADEIRSNFRITLWNARQNITQRIFAGAHSDNGGGYEKEGLSNIPLKWMADNFRKASNLILLPHLLPKAVNPLATAHDDSTQVPWCIVPGNKARKLNREGVEIDGSVLARQNNVVPISRASLFGGSRTTSQQRYQIRCLAV